VTLFSPRYQAVLRETHAKRRWGTKGHRSIQRFLPFVKSLGCQTLLDYGAGSGSVKRVLDPANVGLDISEYDPGVVGIDSLPQPADAVVCTDVMEHVEEQFVVDVLEHICQLTGVCAYLDIALIKAKCILPDGANAHITLKRAEWWLATIGKLPWITLRYDVGKKNLIVYLVKKASKQALEWKKELEGREARMKHIGDFGAAILALKAGRRVYRAGWNGKNMWLGLQFPDGNSRMTLPYVYIEYPVGHPFYPNGSRVPWLASQTDMLGEDWWVLED